MTNCLRLCRWRSETGERFLFILGEHDVARQAEHLEELDGFIVDVGEHHQRTAFLGDVDDPEQDGNADAIDEFGVAEIDDQRAGAGIELLLTLTLDSFAGELVEIVAGVDDGRGADAMRAYV